MEKGTLLELGLLPVITSAFLWQLAAAFRLINVNLGLRSERELFQTGQKITSIALSIVYLAGLFLSNYYDSSFKYGEIGTPLSITSFVFIFVQIFGFNLLITLMTEIIDKGYGFGSGILALLVVQFSSNFIKDVVGLELIPLKNSNKFESAGALSNFVKNFSFKNLQANIINSFTRLQLPNLTQVYIMLFCMLVMVALNNFRIELPIRSTKMRGMNNMYPIKLLYTGSLPLLFAITVLSNFQVFGYFVASILKYPILGTYQLMNTDLVLTNGILYYFSAPSVYQLLLNPVKTIIYSSTVIVLATWFANHWALVSGSAPKDISKQFKDQGISIAGKRDVSITKELSRIIPVASVSGAFAMAVLAIVSEVLGGYGRGISGIIGVGAGFGIMEEVAMELQQSGGASQLLGALGQYQ